METDLKVGGPFNYRASAIDPTLVSDGQALELNPSKRLETTWRALWSKDLANEEPGRVTWEIEPGKQEGGCRVKLGHDQLEKAPNTAKQVLSDGWSHSLNCLKT